MTKFIRIFFIFTFIAANIACIYAQTTKIELSLQAETVKGDFDYGKYSVSNVAFSTGANYYLTKWIDVGATFGWLPTTHYSSVHSDILYINHALCFDINSRLHLIPLITKNSLRFDMYIVPKVFAATKYISVRENEYEWSKLYFNYSIGLGLKYAMTKRMGVFVEIAVGEYFPTETTRAKLGLSFKL
jgi:hypothetical protein